MKKILFAVTIILFSTQLSSSFADGLNDGEEIKGIWGYKTDPRTDDTDGDGVIDSVEIFSSTGFPEKIVKRLGRKMKIIKNKKYFCRTDPTNPDTDGDGVIDGLDPHPARRISKSKTRMSPDWKLFYKSIIKKLNLKINPDDLNNPNADPDKDGISNIEEYINGTVPVISNGWYIIKPFESPIVITAESGTNFIKKIRFLNLSFTKTSCRIELIDQPWCRIVGYSNSEIKFYYSREAWENRQGFSYKKNCELKQLALEPRTFYRPTIAPYPLYFGRGFSIPFEIDTMNLKSNSTYRTYIRFLAPFSLSSLTQSTEKVCCSYTNEIEILLKIGPNPDKEIAPPVPELISPINGTILIDYKNNFFKWKKLNDKTKCPITYKFYMNTGYSFGNDYLQTQLVDYTSYRVPKVVAGIWHTWYVGASISNGPETRSEMWCCGGPSNLPVISTTLSTNVLLFNEQNFFHVITITNSGLGRMSATSSVVERGGAPYIESLESYSYDYQPAMIVITVAVKNAVLTFSEEWRLMIFGRTETQIYFTCVGNFPKAIADTKKWLITPFDNSSNVCYDRVKLTWVHPGLPYEAILKDWKIYLGVLNEKKSVLDLPLYTNTISQFCVANLGSNKTYYWYAETVFTNITGKHLCQTPVFSLTTSCQTQTYVAVKTEQLVKPKKIGWNEESVVYFIKKLSKTRDWNAKKYAKNIVVVARENKYPRPKNINSFLKSVLKIPVKNYKEARYTIDFLPDITNELAADILFWGYTNFYFKLKDKSIDSSLKEEYRMKSYKCCNGLKNIGTPKIIHKLNLINKNFREKLNDKNARTYTISPEHFPKQAKKWLLKYPMEQVREQLAYLWLESTRPETISAINRYILKLEHTPTNNLSKREIKKHIYEIKSLKRRLGNFKKRYYRWILDNKTKRINYGVYSDEKWIKHRQKVLQNIKNKK